METEDTPRNAQTPIRADVAETGPGAAEGEPVDEAGGSPRKQNKGGRGRNLWSTRFLRVGKSGDLTFYAHLSCGPTKDQVVARIAVGLYEDKIRQQTLADRESFVVVSVGANDTEISDSWVAKLTTPAEEPQEIPVQLFGVRHMAFYAKPYGVQYLLANFLALCEAVVDDGDLELVEATWSDDHPSDCLAYRAMNKNAQKPFELQPFANLVVNAQKKLDAHKTKGGPHANCSISWHPSARFIRHFDPELYHG